MPKAICYLLKVYYTAERRLGQVPAVDEAYDVDQQSDSPWPDFMVQGSQAGGEGVEAS